MYAYPTLSEISHSKSNFLPAGKQIRLISHTSQIFDSKHLIFLSLANYQFANMSCRFRVIYSSREEDIQPVGFWNSYQNPSVDKFCLLKYCAFSKPKENIWLLCFGNKFLDTL